MIKPKLLVHTNGRLHAFRGQNMIAWRFGHRIKVCEVKHIFGPFYKRTSHDFFDFIDRFEIYQGQKLKSGPVYEP